jgi:hypothetical protein
MCVPRPCRYPFIFAALGGPSGGNSILFAKSLGEVVKTVAQVGISFGDFCPFPLFPFVRARREREREREREKAALHTQTPAVRWGGHLV